MDELSADSFANRDEPLPLIKLDHDLSDDAGSGGQPGRRRDRLKEHTANLKENMKKKTVETGISLQDRLLERYTTFLRGYLDC